MTDEEQKQASEAIIEVLTKEMAAIRLENQVLQQRLLQYEQDKHPKTPN